MAAERKQSLVTDRPRPITNCNICDGGGVIVSSEGRFAAATICVCSTHCLICKGTRYVFKNDSEGRDLAQMCWCEVRRHRVRLYNEAGIPGKYFDARLADAVNDKHNAQAIGRLGVLAAQYRKGEKGLLLSGQPGSGKTYLLSAFLYELIITRGVPAQFRDFFHLLAELRSGYSNDQPESDLIQPLIEVEVLAIDELGKGRNTPWEQNILDVIISHRYNSNKTTLFTTNYSDKISTTLVERLRNKDNPGTDFEEIKDLLVDRVGPRIYSRLREMCEFVSLGGGDRRPPAPFGTES